MDEGRFTKSVASPIDDDDVLIIQDVTSLCDRVLSFGNDFEQPCDPSRSEERCSSCERSENQQIRRNDAEGGEVSSEIRVQRTRPVHG